MEYFLKNNDAVATVSTAGGELISYSVNGKEYLWNGDEKYWAGHAPVLFPFVSALADNTVKISGTPCVFKDKHGLKPCAFLTQWNVRHGNDGVDYLDMCLVQRSSDFCTAGCINQVQYLVFQHLIARHLGLTPGRFSWFYNNIQIYDRHIEQAKELINREPVDCDPYIWLNPEKTNFYDFTPEDIEVRGYPRKLIKEKNPQMKFEIGI